MYQRLQAYLDQIFADAPKTKRAYDLKEELYANLCDKYNDLIGQGKSEEESYESAVRSIGDVGELLSRISDEPYESEESRKKTALIVAACVGMYIFTLVVMIVLGEMPVYDFVPGVVFFTLAGIPTCVLIYHFLSRPKYQKKDSTVVEEFKQWSAKTERNEQIFGAVSSVFWLLVVAIYFIFSFALRAWAYSWIIFILAAAVQNILRIVFNVTPQNKRRRP